MSLTFINHKKDEVRKNARLKIFYAHLKQKMIGVHPKYRHRNARLTGPTAEQWERLSKKYDERETKAQKTRAERLEALKKAEESQPADVAGA